MKDYLHYLPFFQQMRDEEQFFDGVLETDDGHRFPVHRVVLGLATVYFQTLFTDPQLNQKRIENNKEVYHISGVPYDLMKTIVDYCYSGQIHFTSSNVKDILVTANRFLIIGIVLQCCEWLQNKLSPENCIGYMRVAGTYQNNSLLDASRKCLLKNFHRISSLNDEFCTLSLPELYNFIRDDELGISDEMMAVDAIIQWILHDPAGRCLHLPDLLKAVRLGLLNVNDLIMKIRQRLRLHLSADCSDFLCRINESMKHAPLEVDGNNYFCRPRIPYEIPFVIGGWTSGYPTDFVETFDIRAKRWSYVMNVDKSARAYHRLETLKGCIYILGGFDGTQYYNTVRCYDPVLKHWMDKAPMYHHRCYVSSCVIGIQ